MKRIFKQLLSVLLCLVIGATLMACAQGGGSDDPTKLTMWAGEQWVGTDYANLEKFIDEFNETNDMGLTIELSCKPDFNTSLQSALTRGNAPDLITWSRFNTPTFAKSNYLYPLDDLIARDNIDTTIFQEQTMQECIWDGVTYALPLDVDPWGLYMNMDMFNEYNEKANEDPNDDYEPAEEPTTWSALLDTALKLTQRDAKGQITVTGYTNTEMFGHYFPFLVSAGGTCFGEDGMTDFDNERSVAVIEYLKTLANADICADGRDTKQAFATDMVAIINQSIYFSNYLNEGYPDVNYKFYPLPAYDGDLGGGVNGGMLGGFGIATPNPGRFKDEAWEARHENAWEFMKWWLTEEQNMLRWSEISSTLPALKATYDDPEITESEVLSTAQEYIDNYQIRPQVPGWYYMQVSVFNREFPNYFSGAQTLDELLANLKLQCDNIITQYAS